MISSVTRSPFPVVGAFESLCEERLPRKATSVVAHTELGLPHQGLGSPGPQPRC